MGKTGTNFINCLEIIKISSHPLIYPLLWPKFLATKNYYCGIILGTIDFTDFIGLVNCTDFHKIIMNILPEYHHFIIEKVNSRK